MMGKVEAYEMAFWGGELNSIAGFETLCRRHYDNKKTFQEFEDYLKKRSKLEQEYCKTLSGLSKCFRQKAPVGQLEHAINQFKCEIEKMANSHLGASQFFAKQADGIKKFRDVQTVKAKHIEEALQKAQQSKLTQLSKTIQFEKTFVKRHQERDIAVNNFKEASELSTAVQKELDKAQNRAEKAQADAQKADTAYRSAVMTLEDCRVQWEKEMIKACQDTQELDEERIRKMREELWVAVNVDSKTALEIDNCCEIMRQRLEKCDISEDILAFVSVASTGPTRPEPFLFKPYNSKPNESPVVRVHHDDINPYSHIDPVAINTTSNSHKSKFQTLPKPAKGRSLLPRQSAS